MSLGGRGDPLSANNKQLFKNIFIYVCMYVCTAALGLHCCVRAFSSCAEQGLFFFAVRMLLIAVASFVAEHGL